MPYPETDTSNHVEEQRALRGAFLDLSCAHIYTHACGVVKGGAGGLGTRIPPSACTLNCGTMRVNNGTTNDAVAILADVTP